MADNRITKAMVLAAGMGTRMRPLTDNLPKPLVAVAGKPLIDHVLDTLENAHIETVVVNVHYHADKLEQHLEGRASPAIIISDEREHLLDSGGGIVKALPHLGDAPFFLMNADTIWTESVTPNLARMAAHFDPASMDCLLLLAPTAHSLGYDGRGDFTMDEDGTLTRRQEGLIAPYVYAGAALLAPQAFAGWHAEPFSLNRIFDQLIAKDRIKGLRLEGTWMHVGTPQAVLDAEAHLQTVFAC